MDAKTNEYVSLIRMYYVVTHIYFSFFQKIRSKSARSCVILYKRVRRPADKGRTWKKYKPLFYNS